MYLYDYRVIFNGVQREINKTIKKPDQGRLYALTQYTEYLVEFYQAT